MMSFLAQRPASDLPDVADLGRGGRRLGGHRRGAEPPRPAQPALPDRAASPIPKLPVTVKLGTPEYPGGGGRRSERVRAQGPPAAHRRAAHAARLRQRGRDRPAHRRRLAHAAAPAQLRRAGTSRASASACAGPIPKGRPSWPARAGWRCRSAASWTAGRSSPFRGSASTAPWTCPRRNDRVRRGPAQSRHAPRAARRGRSRSVHLPGVLQAGLTATLPELTSTDGARRRSRATALAGACAKPIAASTIGLPGRGDAGFIALMAPRSASRGPNDARWKVGPTSHAVELRRATSRAELVVLSRPRSPPSTPVRAMTYSILTRYARRARLSPSSADALRVLALPSGSYAAAQRRPLPA